MCAPRILYWHYAIRCSSGLVQILTVILNVYCYFVSIIWLGVYSHMYILKFFVIDANHYVCTYCATTMYVCIVLLGSKVHKKKYALSQP